MKKTTGYLSEDSAAQLRRLAAETGMPQAELVREAVETYVAARAKPRKFLSAGSGHSGRTQSIAEDEEEILRRDVRRDSGWR